MRKLDKLIPYFDQVRLTSPIWPFESVAMIAGNKAQSKWSSFPKAATLSNGRLGHGAGLSSSEAVTRAAGELVEIASCCAWGDEQLLYASPRDVAGESWDPCVIAGFSDEQFKDRNTWNKKLGELDWVPPQADPSRPIGWIKGRSLPDGTAILLPADAVLIGRRDKGDDDAVAVADTNGCAAGETREDALLSALYELIERDATARWWYGQQACPALDPDHVLIDPAVQENLVRRGRNLWLLDITSDLGVPTVAAVATDHDGRHVGAGFATRAVILDAAQSAIIELMQMEQKIAGVRSKLWSDPELTYWFQEVEFGGRAPFAQNGSTVGKPKGEAIRSVAACLRRLNEHACRVAVIDLTRAVFGVPVFRAVSPDLCHWKPRFGWRRFIQWEGQQLAVRTSTLNPWLLRI